MTAKQVAVPTTAQFKTDDEFEDEFGALHDEEIAHQGKLNVTIFAMGDLLNRWQPNDKLLRKLAKDYGYRPATLVQRMYASREIPPEHRNQNLSFTAHLAVLDIKIPDDDRPDQAERAEAAQAARYELLNDATVPLGEVTANKMKKLVRARRGELGQIDLRQRGGGHRGDTQSMSEFEARMAKLSRAGGCVISDQRNIVKVYAAFEEDSSGGGDITITIDNTADFEIDPTITPVNGRPHKFTVTYVLADGKLDDAEAIGA